MGATRSEDLASEATASSRSLRKFSLLLEGGSLALFLIFIVRLLPLLLEMKPLDRNWQGGLVDVLVAQGLLPFLGFVFLHLVVYIQPRQNSLRERLRLVRTLAVVPAIGYALLVPLQLAGFIGELNDSHFQRGKYLSQEARLTDIRESILQASNIQDMNVRLQSLLEPPLSGDQMKQPIAQLRGNLLKEVNARQKEVSRRMKETIDNVDSYGQVINRVGSALGWALAFAAGAVPSGSRSTLLQRMRRR